MTAGHTKADVGETEATLSLCMIVKNEEYFLERCLRSVEAYVDEIIVVDTGSTDRTKSIASAFTDHVYDFEWDDDFSHARNFSLEKATGSWILVLDADELIAESDLQLLRTTMLDSEQDAFFLIQYNYSDDPLLRDWLPVTEPSRYSGDYPGYRRNPIARLFRNGLGIRYAGVVHEIIDYSLEGLDSATLEIPIHHHMDDNPVKPKKDRQLNYLRIMEQELETAPSGRLYSLAAAVCMYYTRDYRKAIQYFEQAVSLDYDVNQSLESMAEAHYRLSEFEEARAIYLRLYRSGFVSFSLCTNLANLLVKSGQFSQAADLLRRALSLKELGDETVARIKQNLQYLEEQLD